MPWSANRFGSWTVRLLAVVGAGFCTAGAVAAALAGVGARGGCRARSSWRRGGCRARRSWRRAGRRARRTGLEHAGSANHDTGPQESNESSPVECVLGHVPSLAQGPVYCGDCYVAQSRLEAIAAPSDIALSLAQTTSSWPTRDPIPQSVPVCTFSRPTRRA